MRIRSLSKGDTIVEMIFAFAIFALVAVTAMMIMNKGMTISQRSLETTLVRQQIDSQAEMIRYIKDTSTGEDNAWQSLKRNYLISSSEVFPLSSKVCLEPSEIGGAKKAFFIAKANEDENFQAIPVTASSFAQPTTYAKLDVRPESAKSEGVWMQMTRAENNVKDGSGNAQRSLEAYDVYIHGCWEASGQSAPMTLGTVVRLYDK